jgi:hypothetical protein
MHDVTTLRTEGIEDLLRRYPQVNAKSTPATRAWPGAFPARSPHRPRNRPRTHRPGSTPAGSKHATGNPPNGSASSTPSPNPSSGDLQRYLYVRDATFREDAQKASVAQEADDRSASG